MDIFESYPHDSNEQPELRTTGPERSWASDKGGTTAGRSEREGKGRACVCLGRWEV